MDIPTTQHTNKGDEIQKEAAAAYFGGLIRQTNELNYENSQLATTIRIVTAERDRLKADFETAVRERNTANDTYAAAIKRCVKLQKKVERLSKKKAKAKR